MAALLLAALLSGCASAGQRHYSHTAPASPEMLLRMADKARARGELPVAAKLYRQAYDAEPEAVRPLVQLGQVLMEMRQPEHAAEAFSAALVQESGNVDALRGLGNARLALHEPEQAIPPLKQALATSANDFRVLNALGVAFDMSGDHKGAQQYYRTGLTLAPDNTPLRSNFALSLALSGDSEEAVETMAPLVNLGTLSPQQRQTMALVYALAGNTAEAERLARMDLDERSVQANLQQIAALRGEDGTALAQAPAEAPAPAPQPVAVVERQALPEPTPAPEPKPATVVAAATQPKPVAQKALPIVPVKASAADGLEPKPAAQQAMAPVIGGDADALAPSTAAKAPRTWLIQLASYHKAEQAELGWKTLSASAPELLASRKPLIEEGRLADESTVWRVRLGPISRFSEAEHLCQDLKSRGVDCYVAPAGS